MQPLERTKYVPKNVSFKASRNSNFLWHSLSRTSVQSQVKPAYKGVHCLFKCFSFALFRFYISLFWKQPWPWNKEMWTWQHKKKAVRLFFPSFILVEICVKLTFSMPDGQKSGFFCYALRVEKKKCWRIFQRIVVHNPIQEVSWLDGYLPKAEKAGHFYMNFKQKKVE